MWKISEGICLLVMIIISIKDIKVQKVSVYALLAAGTGSIIFQIITRQMDWKLVLGGAMVGIGFLGLSKITNEGIGVGDSIGILILGIFLGFWRIITVLSAAFFLLLCVLLPVLWMKKMSKNIVLPFYPFLTGGYLILLLIERME